MHLLGHSAGGHLAYSALLKANVQMERLKSIFLLSSVYDLVPLVHTYVNEAIG
jgi:acetyl esterase/lipase